MEGWTLRYAVRTDIGKKRTVNEDGAAVYATDDGIVLAVIADGMGGHRGGDFASSTAIQLIGEQFLQREILEDASNDDWMEWLHEAILHINQHLFTVAEGNEDYHGMGTTLDAVLLIHNECLIAHVGDSRVYLVSNQQITQITKDHSYVNVLLDSGEITEEEAAVHPQKNWIMKALGSEKTIEPDFQTLQLENDTYLLLCTDGLSNKVDNETIQQIVVNDQALDEKVEALVNLANNRGGEDNISVILFGPTNQEVHLP